MVQPGVVDRYVTLQRPDRSDVTSLPASIRVHLDDVPPPLPTTTMTLSFLSRWQCTLLLFLCGLIQHAGAAEAVIDSHIPFDKTERIPFRVAYLSLSSVWRNIAAKREGREHHTRRQLRQVSPPVRPFQLALRFQGIPPLFHSHIL